jgi:hypothetical protein
MALKLSKWDSAQYLKTEEDAALYFEACLEEAGTMRPLSPRRWAPSPAPVAWRNWPRIPGWAAKAFTRPSPAKAIRALTPF